MFEIAAFCCQDPANEAKALLREIAGLKAHMAGVDSLLL